MSNFEDLRVGNGFDLHRLEEGIPLVIGGVEIPFDRGLHGHSDGDVLTHAVIDALLGAAGLGDIGMHFPPTDESIKGISSIDMLTRIKASLFNEGWRIANIDSTVLCEKPKLSIHYDRMRERLASALEIDSSKVGIKAKTAEKMGPIGEGSAMAAYAVALIAR